MRLLHGLTFLILLLSATPAPAQLLPSALAPAAPAQPAADVDALVRILENDAARAALIARLRGEAAAVEPTGPPTEGLVGRIAEYTRTAAQDALSLLNRAGEVAGTALGQLRGAGSLDLSTVWWAIMDVLAVVAVTVLALLLLRWAAGYASRAFDARASRAGRLQALALLVAAKLLDALTVVLAWAAGYAFALSFGTPGEISFSQTLFLNAFLVVELLKVAVRALLAPWHGHLRLVKLDDAAATYTYAWAGRLISLLGYSFLFAAPLVLYSGSWAAAQSIRLLAMLLATVLVAHVVLRNRVRVQAALAARQNGGKSDMLGRVTASVGSIWHLIVIGYAVAVFVVWLTNPYSALPFMLQATAQSVLAGVIGIVTVALLSGVISGGIRLPPGVASRLPLLESRLNAFVPAILRVVRLLVMLAVVLAVADIWRLANISGWLGSEGGRRLLGNAASLALVLLLGLGLHVVAASWVEYRLNPNFGTMPTPRERTLMALLRNAFSITLVVVIGMLTLSQIGVNIAPLLAGAGVLGLAIGFGAQKLVQDIITGIFIQLDNAMNEGEVVTVAGISGLVERLTIRSVSLRALDGIVHVIPFSAVDKVANMMRHFSCHLIEIGVSYNENIPEVKAAMQAAFDQLRETEHGQFILEPMEMYGLAKFGESALVVMARFKTVPGKHWNAGRAYNEIIKRVFDERGITIPFPHMTLYMGQDKQGKLPPLPVQMTMGSSEVSLGSTLPQAAAQ